VRRTFPDVRIEMTTGLSDDLTHRVEAGELDAAVVTRPEDGGGDLVLAAEEIVWALPPDHAEVSIEQCLETLPFVQFTPGTGIGKLIDTHLSGEGRQPDEVILVDSVEAVMECVREGIGFTALPGPDVERYGSGIVSARSLSDPPLRRSLCLIGHSRLDAGGQIEALAALFPS
ncbi:MAG: LysR substrate-binding domain-containing protein, partial [Pseudomonadota bacterium]